MERIIIFLRAAMERKQALNLLVFTDFGPGAHYPLYVALIVLQLFVEEAFYSKGEAHVLLLKVDDVCSVKIVLLRERVNRGIYAAHQVYEL